MRLISAFRLMNQDLKPKYKKLMKIIKSKNHRRFWMEFCIIGKKKAPYYPLRFNNHYNKDKPFPICRKCWRYYDDYCQPENRNECDNFIQGH